MNLLNKFIVVCVFIIPVWIVAQTTVTGVVTEGESSFTMSDVTVTNQSSLEEVYTDFDGIFEIQASEGDVLVFSLDGYDEIIATYSGQSSIDVIITTSSTFNLEEAVIIGYGTTTHKDATGSVIGLKSEDFNDGLAASPEQLLTGKVAGLAVTTNGGQPGTGSMIRIRGGSSINASSDPLFVVDGIPMDNGVTIAGSANPLNYLNSSDIESISVLKDASSTAIYGARASNGVIIITTKKGKRGKRLGINFNSSVTLSDRINQVDVLSADQFRSAVLARGNDNISALLGTSKTNWQDQIFKKALGYDSNVGITGTIGKNLPFRVSLGYTNQDGILKTSTFERSTASVSLTPSFLDNHLNIEINARGSYEENQFADTGVIGAAVRMDPTQSVYSSDSSYGGYWEWLNSEGNPNPNATRNPLAMLMLKDNNSYVSRSVGNIKFDYKVHGLEDLKTVLNLGYDYSESNGLETVPEYAAINYNDEGLYHPYNQIRRNQLMDFYLNYNKDIASIKSTFDITAGYSYQSFDYDNNSISYNFNQTNIIDPSDIDIYTRTLIGFFGRFNYTFDDKYLLTATIRRDGSSRFSKDNRWGWFPSVSAAWNIAEESFLKDSRTVSNMKLRLGWGITGQENVSGDNPYPYLPVYVYSDNTSNYPIDNIAYPTLRPNIYDPNLKWEEQTTWNLGLDFGFFNNRMWGSVDFYKKETEDMIQTVAASLPNLNNLITTNIGTMENQGVEITLGGDIIRNRDFTWTVNANATYNENELTKISGGINDFYRTGDDIAGNIGNKVLVNMVGASAYSFYVYEQIYDTGGNPIEGAYVDQNGDGIINEQDLRLFHSGRPDWTLGFSSNLNYKNWDFGFSMRANLGNYLYNNIASSVGTYAGLIGTNGYLTNVQTDVLNTQFTNNEYLSDYYIQDASFLKLDYLTIGYTFKEIFEKTDIRFYSTVNNVFTITDYDGLDPEVGSGIDNNIYPRPRVYMFGVNVNF
ncbi:MAG: SusC/RagA family TonB-linked outer membrane protein [Moheibacter sp.]